MTYLDAALDYARAGLSVIPGYRRGAQKGVALQAWKQFQVTPATPTELEQWFGKLGNDLCLVTGAVSGNLELIDFDAQGEAFEAWRALVDPALFARLVIETSPSGGRHAVYRCAGLISPNTKLAAKRLPASGSDEVEYRGKRYRPHRESGEFFIAPTLIETRGEGGMFLCAPSTGYVMVQGDFRELPVLTEEERDALLTAAWSLNEHWPESFEARAYQDAGENARPGDAYNARADVGELLERHGWRRWRERDGQQHWTRPGKTGGTSATWNGEYLYVFTDSAYPLQQGRAYRPFGLKAALDHESNFSAAASALSEQGFGVVPDDGFDLKAFIATSKPGRAKSASDPGSLPEHLYRVPGFVGDVMDFTLSTAPYPNVVLSFAGAISLQAHLAARKVRDAGDNRTNLYVLGLAHSAAGKDWPRKVNMRIAHETGIAGSLGERFASGEGIQDAMASCPAMLFQTDEIDGILQTINRSRDARHESIISTLLTMYSAANSIYVMRRKAASQNGNGQPQSISQPSLCLFGTAVPNYYYAALSERMLSNGFFARMLIFECATRGRGQEAAVVDVPRELIEAANWWKDFNPGGNLANEFPEPVTVPHDDGGRATLVDLREWADEQYDAAHQRDDVVGTTVWGRVNENARKLALVYAVSECRDEPVIGRAAAEWAAEVVVHQARRMLFQAADHVSANPFHEQCLKLVRVLRDSPGHEMDHSKIARAMRLDRTGLKNIVEALFEQGEIEEVTIARQGRPSRAYRLS